MRHSDNYELNLVEGSDIVNPLVQDVPNYEAIDAAMFDNKEHSVGVATELKTGTVHALTRQNADAAVFRFTATSDYTVGDTFEVDGVQVSALLVDGTTLPNRCYIIGSEVLASLKGTLLTIYANRTTASDSDKLGGQLPAYYATDADLDALEGVVNAHTDQIAQLSTDLSNALLWKLHSNVTSGVVSDLPANWNELQVVIFNTQQPYLFYTFNYNKTSWVQGTEHESRGYYRNANDNQVCTLELKPDSIRLERLEAAGTSYTTAGQTHQAIYYR